MARRRALVPADHLPRGPAGRRAPRRHRRRHPRPPGRRSSPARPARARPPSCPRSASSSAAGVAGTDRAHPAAPDRRPDGRRADRRGARRRARRRRSATRCGSPTTASDDTLVKVMTDGILLAEIQRDRDLRRYDTIIIDEAHERSLNIDFLLGYLKQLLPRRPDLKVIITSATIDPRAVRRSTSPPTARRPIIEVSGRTYPVEVRYRPLVERPTAGDVDDRDQVTGDRDAVDELWTEGPRRHPGLPLRRARDPRHRRRAATALQAAATPRSCRCTPGCPRPSSTGCSRRTPAAGSCWPPTSPRPR